MCLSTLVVGKPPKIQLLLISQAQAYAFLVIVLFITVPLEPLEIPTQTLTFLKFEGVKYM